MIHITNADFADEGQAGLGFQGTFFAHDLTDLTGGGTDLRCLGSSNAEGKAVLTPVMAPTWLNTTGVAGDLQLRRTQAPGSKAGAGFCIQVGTSEIFGVCKNQL